MSDVQAQIIITGKADGAVNALNSVKSKVKEVSDYLDNKTKTSFKDFLGGLGVANVTAAGAGAGLLYFGKAAVSAASQLEAVNRQAKALYGGSFPQVKNQIDQLAASIGRSNNDLQQYASGFLVVAQNAKLPQEAAAAMSVELTKLSEDFASFFQIGDDQAFEMIQGGLLGMDRALKRYGVTVSDATVEEYAHRQGITAKLSEMSEGQQLLLRYGSLHEQLSKYEGDAAKNANSFANEAKHLNAEWNDFLETAGTPLLPILAEGLKGVRELLSGIVGHVNAVSQSLQNMYAVAYNKDLSASALSQGMSTRMEGNFAVIDYTSPNFKRGSLAQDAGVSASSSTTLATKADWAKAFGSISGGGGKDAAEELRKAEEAIARAFEKQADATKDMVTNRRDELKLRKELGIITAAEEKELASINRRIAFKKDLVAETTQEWKKQADEVKNVEQKVKDLTKQIADEQKSLADSLKDIERESGRQRVSTIADLLKEKRELEAKANYAGSPGLSGDEGKRLGEINSILKGASQSELSAGDAESRLNPLQKLNAEKDRRIKDATDQSNARVQELQASLDAENQKLAAVREAETQKKEAVVSALNDRAAAVQAALALELKAVQDNVAAQVLEYNKLRSPGSVNNGQGSTTTIPAFADGGIVTRPTLALIGEAGPEAVVPLSKGKGVGASITIGSIHVHNEADEDRLIAKLTRLMEREKLAA